MTSGSDFTFYPVADPRDLCDGDQIFFNLPPTRRLAGARISATILDISLHDDAAHRRAWLRIRGLDSETDRPPYVGAAIRRNLADLFAAGAVQRLAWEDETARCERLSLIAANSRRRMRIPYAAELDAFMRYNDLSPRYFEFARKTMSVDRLFRDGPPADIVDFARRGFR